MRHLIKTCPIIGLAILALVSLGACQPDVEVQLGILLDGSSSIQLDNWGTMTNGLANSVRDVIPKDGTVELTVVQFAGYGTVGTEVEIHPTVITAANSRVVADEIRVMGQNGGGTPLDVGLVEIADTMYASPEFDPAIKQSINIVTDGAPGDLPLFNDTDLDAWVAVELGESKSDPEVPESYLALSIQKRDYLIAKLQMTDDEDRINSEALGDRMTQDNVVWLKESIVWPQPGEIAPPYPNDVGWVKVVKNYSEFEEAIKKKFEIILDLDFGDAPDSPYPTYLNNNGARHIMVDGIHLGTDVDLESDGQPTSGSDGDDNDGNDDEDGVVFTTTLVQGSSATTEVTASSSGKLNTWIDFNKDGDWADPDEQIFTDVDLVAGPNNLNFDVPLNAVIGMTYARFRFNSAGGLSFYGLAKDGEVEDYQVVIEESGTQPPTPESVPNINRDIIDLGKQRAFGAFLGSATNEFLVDKDQKAGELLVEDTCVCGFLVGLRQLNSYKTNEETIHSENQLAIAIGGCAENQAKIKSRQGY